MRKTMTLAILVLMVLNCLVVVRAEDINVSLRVKNVPPKVLEKELALSEEIIYVSFLVEESNTLTDLKKISVIVFENEEKGLSFRKFVWEGVGKEWNPKPYASFFPPMSQSREKYFRFLLEVHREQNGEVFVVIVVSDSEHTQSYYCGAESNQE